MENKNINYISRNIKKEIILIDGIRIENQIQICLEPFLPLYQLGKLSPIEIETLIRKEVFDLEEIFIKNLETNYSYFKWKAFLISNDNKPTKYEAKKLFFPKKMEDIFAYFRNFFK